MSNDETEILTHEEVLAILSRKAKAGSVGAAIALERALRTRARETDRPLEEELGELVAVK